MKEYTVDDVDVMPNTYNISHVGKLSFGPHTVSATSFLQWWFFKLNVFMIVTYLQMKRKKKIFNTVRIEIYIFRTNKNRGREIKEKSKLFDRIAFNQW